MSAVDKEIALYKAKIAEINSTMDQLQNTQKYNFIYSILLNALCKGSCPVHLYWSTNLVVKYFKLTSRGA